VSKCRCTYPVLRELAIDLQFPHLEDDGLRAIDEVLIYCPPVANELVLRKAVLVYDFHLLHDSRLS
jgi:hypothetical protein